MISGSEPTLSCNWRLFRHFVLRALYVEPDQVQRSQILTVHSSPLLTLKCLFSDTPMVPITTLNIMNIVAVCLTAFHIFDVPRFHKGCEILDALVPWCATFHWMTVYLTQWDHSHSPCCSSIVYIQASYGKGMCCLHMQGIIPG